MWDTTLVRIAKEDVCDLEHLEHCYQHLIPAYKEDLNRSLCHTTTDTKNAPTFSGVVGFRIDEFCKTSATMYGRRAGKVSAVSQSCTTQCGISGYDITHHISFLGPCKAPQTLCFFEQCGKKYSRLCKIFLR
ncbi:uncharacterized protein LOC135374081 [Ornithodoros turicata]|uniref:uncharacterized protein LOC135374081 n=1 Tax=Ornithodoros turicata TaxID=34597 RepID=UPI003138FA3F